MYTHVARHTVASKGFTLVELMVTISVLAVLVSVALPDLRNFMVGSRLSSDVNGLIGLLNYARSEAIVRNQSVVICPRATGAANTCEDTQYWGKFETQVFVDADATGTYTAGDEVLKILPATDPTDSQRRINRMTSTEVIKFGAVGFAQNTHRFAVYAVGDAAFEIKYGRTVCISKPGRVRVAISTDLC